MSVAMKSYEELEQEVAMLRRKLSPLENKEFTALLAEKLEHTDLLSKQRNFRGGNYIVVFPKEFWFELYGEEGNSYQLTNLGRSLQALCWERSAINGHLCFVKEVEEYRETLH